MQGASSPFCAIVVKRWTEAGRSWTQRSLVAALLDHSSGHAAALATTLREGFAVNTGRYCPMFNQHWIRVYKALSHAPTSTAPSTTPTRREHNCHRVLSGALRHGICIADCQIAPTFQALARYCAEQDEKVHRLRL